MKALRPALHSLVLPPCLVDDPLFGRLGCETRWLFIFLLRALKETRDGRQASGRVNNKRDPSTDKGLVPGLHLLSLSLSYSAVSRVYARMGEKDVVQLLFSSLTLFFYLFYPLLAGNLLERKVQSLVSSSSSKLFPPSFWPSNVGPSENPFAHRL